MRIACQALIAVTLAAGLSLPAQAAYLWAARTDDGAVSLRLGELSSPGRTTMPARCSRRAPSSPTARPCR
ncbi:hypothetical protein DAI18_08630 [Microvirgula aerodenitrificans]|uniref:Uncharacterized protein n=1 Tax=Microvirgula aerodenitrificans TaxID=57480 RepID=A0A2S0P9M6_9NEIS|nr:hypothetical protein [Microvirgula aerodenitrificans]AVY94104.1 hypothetical protein DAI18_08630 [Microvirgula aerodenitrificans]